MGKRHQSDSSNGTIGKKLKGHYKPPGKLHQRKKMVKEIQTKACSEQLTEGLRFPITRQLKIDSKPSTSYRSNNFQLCQHKRKCSVAPTLRRSGRISKAMFAPGNTQQKDSAKLQNMADQIEKLLHKENGFLGQYICEESSLIVVDVHKGDYETLKRTAEKMTKQEIFKHIYFSKQEPNWQHATGAIKLNSQYSGQKNGTLGALAKCKNAEGHEIYYLVTCKHVVSTEGKDDFSDLSLTVPENPTLVDPTKYLLIDTVEGYFVDIALIEANRHIKDSILNDRPDNIITYCDSGKPFRRRDSKDVQKIGIGTNHTFGFVQTENICLNNFGTHKGIVCLVVGNDRDTPFCDKSDSGSLVTRVCDSHAIGFISGFDDNYQIYDARLGHTIQKTRAAVVYLDSCIRALKERHSELKNLKLINI